MLKKDQCWRCDTVCTSANPKIPCRRCEVAHYCSDECKDKDKFRHAVDCQTGALNGSCSGCGEEKSGLKRCLSCYQAWYCGQTCQRKSWPTHKLHCKQVTKDTEELSGFLKLFYEGKKMMPGVGTVYYWGNVPAIDLINLPLNEGCDYSKPLSILVCGVGDPRNVALSMCQLPDAYQEEVTFVLNDICACTLARTVLILYLLYKGGSKVASSVTQIWYSLRLSEEDYQLVTRTLQELAQGLSLEDLTSGAMKMNEDQFHRLVQVWRTWLDLSSRQGDWIKEARRKMFERDSGSKEGMELYYKEIPAEHKKSATDWFKNGILIPKHSRKTLPRENFTLTGSDYTTARNKGDFTYILQPNVIPFTSWDYRDAQRLRPSTSLLEMYSQYIGHVLEKCALRLTSGRVKFHFLLCNCMEMNPFLPPDRKYDRVTMSNIADYVPVTSLLDACKPLLNAANLFSAIVTEFQNWCVFNNLKQEIMLLLLQMPKSFNKEVLKDTNNPAIAYSTGWNSFVEYHDHSVKFIRFLRAALMITDLQGERTGRRSWKSVAEHNGLVARNFLRCQNRIVPARWPINCRRVTMLSGFEKAVEWIFPPQ